LDESDLVEAGANAIRMFQKQTANAEHIDKTAMSVSHRLSIWICNQRPCLDGRSEQNFFDWFTS